MKEGELPRALELDERSDPTLTDDLLHLVHGRSLLGVVQLPKTLRLEGVCVCVWGGYRDNSGLCVSICKCVHMWVPVCL